MFDPLQLSVGFRDFHATGGAYGRHRWQRPFQI
jgi:hypothetical protein